MNKVFGSQSDKNIPPSFLSVRLSDRVLLIASSVSLLLALIGCYAAPLSEWPWLAPGSFVTVTFLAPALAILSCLDYYQSGRSPNRILAIAFSIAAITTVVATLLYQA